MRYMYGLNQKYEVCRVFIGRGHMPNASSILVESELVENQTLEHLKCLQVVKHSHAALVNKQKSCPWKPWISYLSTMIQIVHDIYRWFRGSSKVLGVCQYSSSITMNLKIIDNVHLLKFILGW